MGILPPRYYIEDDNSTPSRVELGTAGAAQHDVYNDRQAVVVGLDPLVQSLPKTNCCRITCETRVLTDLETPAAAQRPVKKPVSRNPLRFDQIHMHYYG